VTRKLLQSYELTAKKTNYFAKNPSVDTEKNVLIIWQSRKFFVILQPKTRRNTVSAGESVCLVGWIGFCKVHVFK
jgi:hypothetical protein